MSQPHPNNLERRDVLRRIGRLVVQIVLISLILVVGLSIGIGLRRATGEMGGKPTGTPGAEAGRKIAFWKSSMIPNFVSPKPGVDPMGMDLIPVYVDELAEERFLVLSPEQMQNIGLRLATVAETEAERIVRSVGRVDYAEPLLGDVTLKIGGWIEKLLVNYVGQRVKKGEPMFSIYSPDLVSAEDEYLIQSRLLQPGETTRGQDVFSAYDKLRYWDVPSDEIEAIRREGHAKKSITFRSPFSGWVIEKSGYEGMYMKPGMRIFRIADLSAVWVYVYVYEYQLPWLHVRQSARLTLPFRPGQVFEGKVVYIYPHVDPQTRQIRVRLEFTNPQLELKPEMYGNVEIATQHGRRMAVPLDAIIYTGAEKTWQGSPHRAGFAYVQMEPGTFEAREVVFGQDLEEGKVEVLSGLNDGEQVVVDGQFLLDSERKVKQANLAMFAHGQKSQAPPASSPQSRSSPSHNSVSDQEQH